MKNGKKKKLLVEHSAPTVRRSASGSDAWRAGASRKLDASQCAPKSIQGRDEGEFA